MSAIPVPGSESLITTIEPGQITLANVPLQVNGGVSFSLLNTTGRKVQQGEPGPDDHPVDSTIIQRSATGGGQVLYSRGDQDANRFYDGDSLTTNLEWIGLPPAITAFTGPNEGQAVVLGQYPKSTASKVLAAWNDRLCRLNVAGDGFDDLAAFTTDAPIGKKGVAWKPNGAGGLKFYIPTGPSYHTWDGTSLTRYANSAVDFLVWQDKLFRLDQDGNLFYTIADPATWNFLAQVQDGSDARKLVLFYDRNNVMGVNVTTDSTVFTLDFDDSLLFQSDQFWPRHPNFGLAAIQWRADLYVAAGLGIQRQSNGFINAVGPDRDWSLPKELAGFIVDMEPAFNQYFALIQGQTIAGGSVQTDVLRLTGQDTMTFSVGATLSSLYQWDGLGWSRLWKGPGVPTSVYVANPPGEYWVYWACGALIYRRPLSLNYENPREEQAFPFALQSEHITSRYNWGWVNIPKVAKRWECSARQCTGLANIQIYYRVDDPDAGWTLLATITQDGRQSFRFGETAWDGQSLHYGTPHEWIQFRYVFNRDPATPLLSPYLEWWAAVGRKWLLPIRTWKMQIDVEASFKDMDLDTAISLFEELVATPGAQPFVHKDRLYMVDIEAVSGMDATGNEQKGTRNLTLVETDETFQFGSG